MSSWLFDRRPSGIVVVQEPNGQQTTVHTSDLGRTEDATLLIQRMMIALSAPRAPRQQSLFTAGSEGPQECT